MRTQKIQEWLNPDTTKTVQCDEYYATHFLIGAKLITGENANDEDVIRRLAVEFKIMRQRASDSRREDKDSRM